MKGIKYGTKEIGVRGKYRNPFNFNLNVKFALTMLPTLQWVDSGFGVVLWHIAHKL